MGALASETVDPGLRGVEDKVEEGGDESSDAFRLGNNKDTTFPFDLIADALLLLGIGLKGWPVGFTGTRTASVTITPPPADATP